MPSGDEIRDVQRATWAGLSAGWEKWDPASDSISVRFGYMFFPTWPRRPADHLPFRRNRGRGRGPVWRSQRDGRGQSSVARPGLVCAEPRVPGGRSGARPGPRTQLTTSRGRHRGL